MGRRESTAKLIRDVRKLTGEFIRRQQRKTAPPPSPPATDDLDLAALRRELMLRIHPDRPGGDTELAQRINRLWDALHAKGIR